MLTNFGCCGLMNGYKLKNTFQQTLLSAFRSSSKCVLHMSISPLTSAQNVRESHYPIRCWGRFWSDLHADKPSWERGILRKAWPFPGHSIKELQINKVINLRDQLCKRQGQRRDNQSVRKESKSAPNHNRMRRTVIVLLSLTVAASRQSLAVEAAGKESYWAYSSCPSSTNKDWAKARPYKLKSWLGSIVPGMCNT